MSRARSLLAAEMALGVVSIATVIGFRRVFDSWEFLAEFLVAALAGHLVAIACRRMRVGLALACVIGLLGLGVVTALLFYRDSTAFGFPTRATWDAGWAAMADAWAQFAEVKAPTPALPGFLLAGAMALYVAAFAADAFAFRLQTAFEAILPTGVVFVFVSMLSAPSYRLVSTGLYLGAVLAFAAMHRAERLEHAPGRLATKRRAGPGTVLRAGGVLTVATVALALVFGPATPGAGEEALVDWKHGGRSKRVVLTPLVEIRKRLTNQSDIEAFTVKALPGQRSYWRLTALEDFDGDVWGSSPRKYSSEDGALPSTQRIGTEVVGPAVPYSFTITGLSSPWLPHAYPPVQISGVRFGYDPATDSLLYQGNQKTEPEVSYVVTAVVPQYTAEELASSAAPSADLLERYTTLDDPDLEKRWGEFARGIVAGAANDYEKALLLQNWFRDNFEYDLDSVEAGHDEDAIEVFLENRRGYCEQFAGTYAVFARLVGLPTRVAVGFTWGVYDPDEDLFRVQGRHAHAWVEVYFQGNDWVPFDPTPSRGIPGAEGYTNVPEEQDPLGTVDASTPTTTVAPNGSQAPVTLNPNDLDGGFLPGLPLDQQIGAGDATKDRDGSGWSAPTWLGIVGVALGLGVVLWLLGVPLTRRLLRGRRRRGARTPAARVLVAWSEAVEAFGLAGVPAVRAETPREFASRATEAIGDIAVPVARLAGDATEAAFSGTQPAAEVVTRAGHDALEVKTTLRRCTPRHLRLARALDPRTLRPVHTQRRSVHEHDRRPH